MSRFLLVLLMAVLRLTCHVACRAFNTCPFDDVKVVILGQDPYHNVNQAMGAEVWKWSISRHTLCMCACCNHMPLFAGLSFSVPAGQPVPSSLKNIYKEIANDCGCTVPKHGSLIKVICAARHQVVAMRCRCYCHVHTFCREFAGEEDLSVNREPG